MRRTRQNLGAALRGQVMRGELGWVFRAGARGVALRLGLPIRAPLFATLAMTWRCNYRCFFCDLPLRQDRQPDTEELCQRVRELAEQGVLALGLTGGEPLLHPGLWEVVAEARRCSLLTHLNSNGSCWDQDTVTALCTSGLHSLNVSLDGARPETHDRLRQAPGSFAGIQEGVRRLLQEKRRPRLSLVMAVSRDNRDQIQDFVALGQDLGVDAVGFLPHHTLVDDAEPFRYQEVRDLQQDLHAVASRTEHSDRYLEGMSAFLAGAEMPVQCSAPRTHVALDPEGTAYPCVPLMTVRRGGRPWEEWRAQGSLPLGEQEQEVCRRCWWNCHRELDLGLGILEGAPAANCGCSPSSSSSPTSPA